MSQDDDIILFRNHDDKQIEAKGRSYSLILQRDERIKKEIGMEIRNPQKGHMYNKKEKQEQEIKKSIIAFNKSINVSIKDTQATAEDDSCLFKNISYELIFQ